MEITREKTRIHKGPRQPGPVLTESKPQPTPSPPVIEPVLLIHGTWANKADGTQPDWWHPGSEFCKYLDDALANAGSSARCWSGVERPARPPFAWTGSNLEMHRLTAGQALAARLAAFENDARITRYHLVAHSHGGNVVLNALRELDAPPTKLGAVVFMGTPVLQFHHRGELDSRWVALPMFAALLAAGVWAYERWPDQQPITGFAMFSVAFAAVMELARGGRPGRRGDQDLYGSGRPHAFVFNTDEALNGLGNALGVVLSPGKFVNQFVSTKEVAPAFKPEEPPRRTLSDRLKHSGAYLAIDAIKTNSTADDPVWRTVQAPQGPQVVEGQRGLKLPRGTGVSTGMSPGESRVVAVTKFISGITVASPWKEALALVLWVCAVVPLMVIMLASGIYSLVMRVWYGVIGGGVFHIAKLLGKIAMPRLIGRAAFGSDAGRFISVESLPPGIAEAEPISAALQSEVDGVLQTLGSAAGVSVLNAIAKRDSSTIKAVVTEALSNPELVHSYYYQSPIVRDRIVELIITPQTTTLFALGSFRSPLLRQQYGVDSKLSESDVEKLLQKAVERGAPKPPL